MIDFHVLTREAQTSPYLDKTLASLEGFSSFVVDKVTNLGEGRLEGFKRGQNPYVSYCDDDDTVDNLPRVVRYLKSNPSTKALYTNSMMVAGADVEFLDENDKKIEQKPLLDDTPYDINRLLNNPNKVHQLIVVERELAIEAATKAYQMQRILLLPHSFDFLFRMEVAYLTDWTFFNEFCYNWRIWSKDQMHLHNEDEIHKVKNHYVPFFKREYMMGRYPHPIA